MIPELRSLMKEIKYSRQIYQYKIYHLLLFFYKHSKQLYKKSPSLTNCIQTHTSNIYRIHKAALKKIDCAVIVSINSIIFHKKY